MKIAILFVCFAIAGCAATATQEKVERKNVIIYDKQGKTKEHVIVEDGHITVYDRDWRTKGYGKVKG